MTGAFPNQDSGWRALRSEFPAAARVTYLNTASAALLPRRAAEQGQRFYAEMLLEGDAGRPRWESQRAHVRGQVAAILNASPAEIVLTSGASQAFTLLAALLGPPSHVVAMRDEFPRVTIPFRRHGDQIAWVESGDTGDIPVDRIAQAITSRTRAVIASAVMHASGFRQDLAAVSRICRAHGVPLVVDASQAVGLVSLDVQRDGIDALAFAGYKGTMGGYGSGALYVGRPLLESPAAARVWSARDAPHATGHDEGTSASMLELGNPPLAATLALGGGIDLLQEIGLARVEARVHELTEYLHRRLDERGLDIASPRVRDRRAGITIVRWSDAAAAVRTLADAGIIVSARGAGLRISVHVFNLEEDLDRLAAALAAIREGRPVPPRPATGGRLACVDLNGVLDAYRGWQGPEHWDPPASGAIEFLEGLRSRGFLVVVFTTRHYRGVWTWLRHHGLDRYVDDVTDVKPPADVFVDDRAVRFTGDFAAALREIDTFSPHWEKQSRSGS